MILLFLPIGYNQLCQIFFGDDEALISRILYFQICCGRSDGGISYLIGGIAGIDIGIGIGISIGNGISIGIVIVIVIGIGIGGIAGTCKIIY